MPSDEQSLYARRNFLRSAGAFAGVAVLQGCVAPRQPALVRAPLPAPNSPVSAHAARPVPASVVFSPRPALLDRAVAALDTHRGRIARRDRIAIADFTAPSNERRVQFVDLESGRVSTMLVAHGSGSDPAHCGRLERFSNVQDSNATSEGAYVTDDYYVGQHGRSQRLLGLDPTNDNAFARAIVVHGAWYAESDMLAKHGKLGRSQGCFAVGEGDLSKAFAMLDRGRMIWAGKA